MNNKQHNSFWRFHHSIFRWLWLAGFITRRIICTQMSSYMKSSIIFKMKTLMDLLNQQILTLWNHSVWLPKELGHTHTHTHDECPGRFSRTQSEELPSCSAYYRPWAVTLTGIYKTFVVDCICHGHSEGLRSQETPSTLASTTHRKPNVHMVTFWLISIHMLTQWCKLQAMLTDIAF